MTKLIALSTNLSEDKITLRHTYPDAVVRGGALPLLLPCNMEVDKLSAMLDQADALILTGGADIAPDRYGMSATPEVGQPSLVRDACEWELLRMACERHMPVLGICRGLQMINVFFGGTLCLDLASKYGETFAQPHDQSTENRAKPVHFVDLQPDSRLAHTLGHTHYHVNSFHHQAVDVLAPHLRCVGTASDGLCEAVEHDTLPIMGVQWHPEDLPEFNVVDMLFAQ